MLRIMSFLGLVPKAHHKQASLVTGSLMLIWALFYQLSVDKVTYSLGAILQLGRTWFDIPVAQGLFHLYLHVR